MRVWKNPAQYACKILFCTSQTSSKFLLSEKRRTASGTSCTGIVLKFLFYFFRQYIRTIQDISASIFLSHDLSAWYLSTYFYCMFFSSNRHCKNYAVSVFHRLNWYSRISNSEYGNSLLKAVNVITLSFLLSRPAYDWIAFEGNKTISIRNFARSFYRLGAENLSKIRYSSDF